MGFTQCRKRVLSFEMNPDLNLSMDYCGDDFREDGRGNSGGCGCEENVNNADRSPDNTGRDDLEQSDIIDSYDSVSLCMEIEKKLEIGCSVESLDHAYLLYCEYARRRGFSVRKGDQSYYWGTNQIRAKEYTCSCEGVHDDKRSRERLAVNKKQLTRTDCKARIRIVREKQNEEDFVWKVQKFDKEHNHELVPFDQSYLLRSVRQLTHSKQSVMEALKSAGIGVSQAYKFLEKESGVSQNVGFTKKDAYNHLSKQRLKTSLENVDASALVQFFVRKSIKEPLFYWNVQLDDDGRLMNFFFRDSRSLIDYEYFGDILSIDTTYKMNKYDMICAPFVGINHHMKNVMFGLALLSNESTTSFEWLFSSFLESMHGKEPQVIFSNQSTPLMEGIDSKFRNANHRLCQWHISRNAPSHFGSLSNNSEFKRMWNYCMDGVETEAEFEHCWHSMIRLHDLVDNEWFSNMYKLRKKWASVLTNPCFSASMLATSRSELTNKVLKELCSTCSSLIEFVEGYQQIVIDWRTRESADDFVNIGNPRLLVSNSLLLSQASKKLTRSVFKAFESQIALAITVGIIEHPVNRTEIDLQYKVASQPTMTRIRIVHYNRDRHIASCSCRMWETEGVLCRHIFRIYMDMNVTQIPECYFLSRWCKTAKQRHPTQFGGQCEWNGGEFVDEIAFVNYVMRLTLEVTQLAKGDRAKCKNLVDSMTSMKNELMNSVAAKDNNSLGTQQVGEGMLNSKIVRDPSVKHRASPAQASPPISHWNKKKTKFGHKPPVPGWQDVECSQNTNETMQGPTISQIQNSVYAYSPLPSTQLMDNTNFNSGVVQQGFGGEDLGNDGDHYGVNGTVNDGNCL